MALIRSMGSRSICFATASGAKCHGVLKPGDPGLSATALAFTLPASAKTGPGSFVVSNQGAKGDYAIKSNAVSVPIGAAITVSEVKQDGCTVRVSGTGYAVSGLGLPSLTVINLFNQQGAGAVNLGGFSLGGTPNIPLDVSSPTQFSFTMPPGIVPGPAYVQVINPPFVPFTNSGDSPAGAFTAANCTAPTSSPTVTPTHTPISTPTPTRQPTPTMTKKPTPVPTPTAKPTPTPVSSSAAWPMFHHDPKDSGQSQFDTSADTGSLKWKLSTGGPVNSSPAVGPTAPSMSVRMTTIFMRSIPMAAKNGFSQLGAAWSLRRRWGPTAPSMSVRMTTTFMPSIPTAARNGSSQPEAPRTPRRRWVPTGPPTSAGVGYSLATALSSALSTRSIPTAAKNGCSQPQTACIPCTPQRRWEATGPPTSVLIPFCTNCLGYSQLFSVNSDGSQKWWDFAGYPADSSPAVGADGTIYVGSQDGNLYAVH